MEKVYLVTLTGESTTGGSRTYMHTIVGIYKKLDEAIKIVLANSADDLDEDDIRENVIAEGACECYQHNAMVGDLFMKRVVCTISEETLLE